MSDLFASGRIVDAILVLMLLEAAGLAVWRWRTGGGLSLRAVTAALGAGAALLLALRAALTGASWPVVAFWLAAALLAHAADLAARLGTPGERTSPRADGDRPVSRGPNG
ncbi:MAG: hypothetical protein JSR21_12295 [Proteobacteria bacterium]|nr:hypothetical protein [Pseudomonadota bacterium]